MASVTLREVAARAGVSIKTVSNVVNGVPSVRPETRERVEEAIRALGYQPNLSARHLRSGRSGVIALAIPELRHTYFAELAGEVIAAAKRRGMGVLIEETGGDRETELDMLRGPRLAMVDGLIMSTFALRDGDEDLLDVGFPLVLLGESMASPPVDHVAIGNVGGAKAATAHLLSLGRRRIALLGVMDSGSSRLRLEGYRQALAEAGVPFDESLVNEAEVWHRAEGAASVVSMLERGIEFDAILGFNDLLALGGMHTLEMRGIRVPEDVAVIGFDDLDEARYAVPPLSSVDPNRKVIADTAVGFLVEQMNGEVTPSTPRRVAAPFALVPRASTTG
ncbi:LacI family DNA-binding transcriptional regulator [Demequina sp. NBRC 110054]|uniref:LacI family DNA-binding transcriptional regulator n=1 Tax=Demequina sp. NBRC 110054 TaxID=1570343 RepID=UPI000A05E598|nr:LacI family DNA-binding transcriptional regulator [Demequina sp. NBRC 110054]